MESCPERSGNNNSFETGSRTKKSCSGFLILNDYFLLNNYSTGSLRLEWTGDILE